MGGKDMLRNFALKIQRIFKVKRELKLTNLNLLEFLTHFIWH